MSESLAITLHSGSVTADGYSDAVDLESDGIGLRRVGELVLTTSAVSVSLSVTVQTSTDGASWTDVMTLYKQTAVGSLDVLVGELQRYVRVGYALAGGTATFELSGTALQTFATLQQLYRFGLPETALSGLDNETKLSQLLAATGEVRSYLGKKSSNIVSVGPTVVRATAKIAAWELIVDGIGVNAKATALELLRANVEDMRTWLGKVASNKVDSGSVFVDDTPTVAEGGGYGDSDEARNWGALAP